MKSSFSLSLRAGFMVFFTGVASGAMWLTTLSGCGDDPTDSGQACVTYTDEASCETTEGRCKVREGKVFFTDGLCLSPEDEFAICTRYTCEESGTDVWFINGKGECWLMPNTCAGYELGWKEVTNLAQECGIPQANATAVAACVSGEVPCKALATAEKCAERDDCAVVSATAYNVEEACFENRKELYCIDKAKVDTTKSSYVIGASGTCWLVGQATGEEPVTFEALGEEGDATCGKGLGSTSCDGGEEIPEACEERTLEQCGKLAGCTRLSGLKFDDGEQCVETEQAFCAKAATACDDGGLVWVKDDDGTCWWFGGVCGATLPTGWQALSEADYKGECKIGDDGVDETGTPFACASDTADSGDTGS